MVPLLPTKKCLPNTKKYWTCDDGSSSLSPDFKFNSSVSFSCRDNDWDHYWRDFGSFRMLITCETTRIKIQWKGPFESFALQLWLLLILFPKGIVAFGCKKDWTRISCILIHLSGSWFLKGHFSDARISATLVLSPCERSAWIH